METVQEIKQQILDALVEKGETKTNAKKKITEAYNKLAEKNSLFKINAVAGFNIVASNFGVTLASQAVKYAEAVPLKIDQVQTDPATNFDIEGFIMTEVAELPTEKPMMIVAISDETGCTKVTVFSEQLDTWFDETLDLKMGTYIKVHNLWWKDKSDGFAPMFTKLSSIELAEPPIKITEVKGMPIADMVPTVKGAKKKAYYTIKGIVLYVPEDRKMKPKHCLTGHWFKGLDDKDIGTLSHCAGCEKAMKVLNFMQASGVQVADEGGQAEIDISSFAQITDINAMDQVIITGEYKTDENHSEPFLNAYQVEIINKTKKN